MATNLESRGPSWNAQLAIDPFLVFRTTLAPRPDEDEHLLSRDQFEIHLGRPMRVAFHQNGKSFERLVRFGDVTWTPAGDSCRATWKEKKESGFVTFSKAFIEQAADAFGTRTLPEFAFSKPSDPLTRELLLALTGYNSLDRLYAYSLANTLIMHLLNSTGHAAARASDEKGKLSQEQLRRALEYVEDHTYVEIDLASWAKEVRLSPFHFARMFRQTTGYSPHRFVQQRKIECAKSFLSATNFPLSSLAYDLGFANQSHFNRVFRQYTQMTPGEWRSLNSLQPNSGVRAGCM